MAAHPLVGCLHLILVPHNPLPNISCGSPPICCLQAFEYPADLFLDDEDEGAFSTASIFGEDDAEVEDDAEYEDDRSALFVPETEDQDVDSSLAAAILGAMTPRELAALDSKEEPAQVSSLCIQTSSHSMLHAFMLH